MKKVMLITGGSRGIGAATVILAARRGYAVCINYRSDRQSAEALLEDIRSGGGEAIAIAADVSREDDIKRLFTVMDEQLGSITALVNNAGILERQMFVEQMTAEHTRKAR